LNALSVFRAGETSVRDLTLDLLDVEPKPNQHQSDCNQGNPQPDSPVVALKHGFLASLQVLGGDLQAGLNILIYQVRPEAVNRDSSLG
jgi:hypothetical protein